MAEIEKKMLLPVNGREHWQFRVRQAELAGSSLRVLGAPRADAPLFQGDHDGCASTEKALLSSSGRTDETVAPRRDGATYALAIRTARGYPWEPYA
jgi:hypothetical protein